MIVFLFAFLWLAVYSGVVWRLRGGALATLCDIHVGTQVTRMMCLGAIACALYCEAWALNHDARALLFLVIFAALWMGVAIAGWAPFQEMGQPPVNMPEPSWLRALPLALGLKIGTFWHDFVGMAEAGIVCMLPCFWVAIWLGHHCWVLLLTGVAFAPGYALARLHLPVWKNFAEGQEWGEIFAGAFVGAGLFIVFT